MKTRGQKKVFAIHKHNKLSATSNRNKSHTVLASASVLAVRIIIFPLLIFCKLMVKLEDYGLTGLLMQMICLITIPTSFVLSMIFLPIPSILKAIASIYVFLAWGLLRQDHTDKV